MTAELTIEQRIERVERILGIDGAGAMTPVPWALRRSAVMTEAARLWRVTAAELTGESRVRALVLPRAALVMALRCEPAMSYPLIGRALGRDHSSIINLERIAHVEFASDAVFAARDPSVDGAGAQAGDHFVTAAARKTSIDPTQQHRRALLAKVHIAKKQLGLADDDYRAIIFQHCGAMSAADATEAQLAAIVQHFGQRGFKATAKGVPGRRAPAVDTPSARKARSLWISLHQLGAVRNASEHALEAFACRQLRCEHWRWSDQSMAYQLIEALKAMAKRHGWEVGDGRTATLQGSKSRLVKAILAKLVAAGVAHSDWTVPDALFRLTGEQIRAIDLSVDIEALTRAAQLLGAVLRDRSPEFSPET